MLQQQQARVAQPRTQPQRRLQLPPRRLRLPAAALLLLLGPAAASALPGIVIQAPFFGLPLHPPAAPATGCGGTPLIKGEGFLLPFVVKNKKLWGPASPCPSPIPPSPVPTPKQPPLAPPPALEPPAPAPPGSVAPSPPLPPPQPPTPEPPAPEAPAPPTAEPSPQPQPEPLQPAASCTPRLCASTATAQCPPGWTLVAAGRKRHQPPRCAPPLGSSCADAPGEYAGGRPALTQSLELLGGGAEQEPRPVCRCADDTKGRVLARLPASDGGGFGCLAHAVFLLDALGPGLGDPAKDDGIWVPLLPEQMACNGTQTCWDACFFCNGQPRYFHENEATWVQRPRRYRRIESCQPDGCVLGDLLVDALKEWHASCTEFAAQSAPAYNHGLFADSQQWPADAQGARVWPYRPRATASPRHFEVAGLASLPPDHGQLVMEGFD